MNNIPEDLKYTEEHTWSELLDDGSIKVGITDFAQSELGDIVFVELPEMDRSYTAGEECAVVESVKSASDIYCPISGEIIAVNEKLGDLPEKINTNPYDSGWIFILMPDDENDINDLMDADGYRELIDEEESD